MGKATISQGLHGKEIGETENVSKLFVSLKSQWATTFPSETAIHSPF